MNVISKLLDGNGKSTTVSLTPEELELISFALERDAERTVKEVTDRDNTYKSLLDDPLVVRAGALFVLAEQFDEMNI